LKTVRY